MKHNRSQKVQEAFKTGPVRGPSFKGDYLVCCPFCYEKLDKVDYKFKLSINPELKIYHCFRCGSRGKVELEGFDIEEIEKPKQDLSLLEMPEGCVPINDIAAKDFRKYLEERNLYKECLKIGSQACLYGKYMGRVIIPHILNNEWKGFTARTIYNAEPKYLNASGMDRQNTLFGYEFINTGERYLVEGPLDALALYPYGIASFGKNVTDQQMDLIEKLNTRIVVALDADCWDECREVSTRLLMRGVDSVWCRLPPKTDPGKLKFKVRDYIQNA